jgi:hypothetical protein
MELVSLYWPDFDAPPRELITGSNFGMSRCDQTRTVGDQTRTERASKGGQVAVAHIFLSRSVAKAEENVRSRLLPGIFER